MKKYLLGGISVLFISSTFILSTTLAEAHGSTVPKSKAISTDQIKKIDQLNKDIQVTTPTKNVTSADVKKINDEKLAKAKLRKVMMLDLAKNNPKLFLKNVIKKDKRSKLTSTLQAQVEEEKTLTGKVTVVHVDDFKNQANSFYKYELLVGGKKYDLYPTAGAPLTRSDATIKVSGVAIGDVVVSNDTANAVQVVTTPPPPDSVGDQKTLVILVDFTDSGARPFTKQQAHTKVFYSPMNDLYKEQSYNKTYFSGVVTDWIRLNRPIVQNGYPACSGASIQQDVEIRNYIAANGINLANYDRVLYLLSHPVAGGGCSGVGKSPLVLNGNTYSLSQSWVGLAEYGVEPRTFPWTGLDFVNAHELGHALGVMHANAWTCDNEVKYGDCFHEEYGNFFDTMGYGMASLHFNAFYKDMLGWVNPANALTITQSGSYVLNPLEQASGKVIAKIKNPLLTGVGKTDTPYYLEYRQPIGFDSSLLQSQYASSTKGLFVNQIMVFGGDPSNNMPRLLDVSPGPSWNSWENRKDPVARGSTIFSDPGNGITVRDVVPMGTSSVAFNVTVGTPVCTRSQTMKDHFYAPYEVAAGDSVSIGLQVQNNDSPTCANSNFTVTATSSLGQNIPVNGSENYSNLAPGDSGYAYIDYQVPVGAVGSEIRFTLVVKNTSNNYTQTISRAVTIVPKLRIDSITPISGNPGTAITLQGANFNTGYGGNNISISGDGLSTYLQAVSTTQNSTLSFTFPTKMTDYSGSTPVDVTPPNGDYYINVYNQSSFSDPVVFHVGPLGVNPTVAIVGTPTLTSQLDPLANVEVVKASYDVRVTAGTNRLMVNGAVINTASASSTNISNYNLSVKPTIILPSGSSTVINISQTIIKDDLQSGVYTSSLASVSGPEFTPTGNIPVSISLPLNTTNSLEVVGTKPYIRSITPNPTGGMGITISGDNINGTNLNYVIGVGNYIFTKKSHSGGLTVPIHVNTGMQPGTYDVWVYPEGQPGKQSNLYSLVVTAPPVRPTLTIQTPNGGEQYKVGDQVPITWQIQNGFTASKVKIQLYYLRPGQDPILTTIVSSVNNTGSYTWTVPTTFNGSTNVNATIRVEAIGSGVDVGKILRDQSDGYFTLSQVIVNPTDATAQVVGTPTLETVLDPSIGKTVLKSTFTVRVTAGNQAIVVRNADILTTATSSYHLPFVTTAIIPNIVIYPGQVVDLVVTQTSIVDHMFPGIYTTTLRSLYPTDLNSAKLPAISLPANVSLPKYIIGETSPYIKSVTNPSNGGPITITGDRIVGPTPRNFIVRINGNITETFNVQSNSIGLTVPVQLNSNIIPGYYWLQIYPEGREDQMSNGYGFEVTELPIANIQVTPLPTVTEGTGSLFNVFRFQDIDWTPYGGAGTFDGYLMNELVPNVVDPKVQRIGMDKRLNIAPLEIPTGTVQFWKDSAPAGVSPLALQASFYIKIDAKKEGKTVGTGLSRKFVINVGAATAKKTSPTSGWTANVLQAVKGLINR